MNPKKKASKKRKGRAKPLHAVTRAEVDAIVRANDSRNPTERLYKALCALLYASGLRIAEAIALTPGDLRRGKHGLEITVRNGKGGKARVTSADGWSDELLKSWEATRREILGKAGRKLPLFCTISRGKAGKALTHQQIDRKLKVLGERAGLDWKLHAHAFRHGYAIGLLAEGESIPQIQAQLGHASPQVTAIYLASLDTSAGNKRIASRWRRGEIEE